MKTLNPLSLLDNLLADWASPKVRRLVHGLLLLVASVASIYLAVEGDWRKFIVALIATLYVGSNRANTREQGELGNHGVD